MFESKFTLLDCYSGRYSRSCPTCGPSLASWLTATEICAEHVAWRIAHRAYSEENKSRTWSRFLQKNIWALTPANITIYKLAEPKARLKRKTRQGQKVHRLGRICIILTYKCTSLYRWLAQSWQGSAQIYTILQIFAPICTIFAQCCTTFAQFYTIFAQICPDFAKICTGLHRFAQSLHRLAHVLLRIAQSLHSFAQMGTAFANICTD